MEDNLEYNERQCVEATIQSQHDEEKLMVSFDKQLELMKRLQKDLEDKMKNDFGLVFKQRILWQDMPDIKVWALEAA